MILAHFNEFGHYCGFFRLCHKGPIKVLISFCLILLNFSRSGCILIVIIGIGKWGISLRRETILVFLPTCISTDIWAVLMCLGVDLQRSWFRSGVLRVNLTADLGQF